MDNQTRHDEATDGASSPLADHVYAEILVQIMKSSLDVGAKLPSENDYCQMFSVSRPIVRVALSRLTSDGIIERKRGSGTYLRRRPSRRVADFARPGDVALLLQLIEYRVEVEGAAAALAASRHSTEQMAAIDASFQRLRTEALSGFITPDSDLAFHRSIAVASGNVFFIDTMRMLHEQTARLLHVLLGPARISHIERVQQVVSEHGHIREAIESRDPVLASAAMRMHLARARRRLTDERQGRGSPPAPPPV